MSKAPGARLHGTLHRTKNTHACSIVIETVIVHRDRDLRVQTTQHDKQDHLTSPYLLPT
jgi:hypothetical protein